LGWKIILLTGAPRTEISIRGIAEHSLIEPLFIY
jgi:hypothetical protein